MYFPFPISKQHIYSICIFTLETSFQTSFVPKLSAASFFVQFIEGMSEKIRKGIEAAETDLSKEKEKLTQEEVRGCMIMTVSAKTDHLPYAQKKLLQYGPKVHPREPTRDSIRSHNAVYTASDLYSPHTSFAIGLCMT